MSHLLNLPPHVSLLCLQNKGAVSVTSTQSPASCLASLSAKQRRSECHIYSLFSEPSIRVRSSFMQRCYFLGNVTPRNANYVGNTWQILQRSGAHEGERDREQSLTKNDELENRIVPSVVILVYCVRETYIMQKM